MLLQMALNFFLTTKLQIIEKTKLGYKISAGRSTFFCRSIVNCAGLHADIVAEMLLQPSVRIFPSTGDYYVLDTKAQGVVNCIIFHEPEERGKGLTVVPTVDGNILVGPSEMSTDGEGDFKTSLEGLAKLRLLASRAIPSLPMEHTIRSFGALRPNPFRVQLDTESGAFIREDKSIFDFTIHADQDNPAFLSLIGIKTPGLTCAHELGLYVSDQIGELLGGEINSAFNPNRPYPLRLKDLSLEDRAKTVRFNPTYGRIVCRCRGISEGEIIDSIRQITCCSPRAVTVDGVKRRTGAMSGRCQGSFCTQRIIEILSLELNIPPEEVNKDSIGSIVIGGEKHNI